jgi:hypothetical protein
MSLRIPYVAALVGTLFASGAQAQSTYGFATLPPGSILHAQASVIAKVVQDSTKLQIRVIGYGGDAPMFDAVNSQKADFMVLDVGETADAQQGVGNWQGNAKPNLRTAITMYGFQMGPFVRKDSNINSVADLKGKRVPSGWVQQTGNLPHTNAVLAAGGLTYKDVVQVPAVNVVRAADDFKSGKIDVFFFAVGAPKVAEVAAGVGGVRYLGFTEDQAAKLKSVRQEYYLSPVNPAPHIAGIEKPVLAQTIDFVIGVGTHVKDEVVYEFIKAVHTNKPALVEGHPNFNRFDPKEAGKVQPRLPHHPGAIKYLKEAGIWRGQ